MKPVVAIVGGFLGAGKTTLILKAARILTGRGVRVAVVMNDQGDDLVDAELARRRGVDADQVGGGCFCCRFPDLMDALGRLESHGAQVIFAEAVGSCTDIVSTTLRPLLRDWGGRYRVAPLTVLVHGQPEGEDLEFLYHHQLAEADLVIDRSVDIGWWLEELLRDGVAAGTRPVSVDYARYAQAEAALGWLNARLCLTTRPALSPALVIGPLLERLDADLSAAGIRIVHLKLIDQCATGYVKAAITGNGGEPVAEGSLDASPAEVHELLLNLRALGAPEKLRAIVESAFDARALEWRSLQAFRPAPPSPFHPAAPING